MRRAWSSGGSPAGRVLAFVDAGIEPQDQQKMRKQIELGGTFVGAGWSF
jgi:hypothetical protein